MLKLMDGMEVSEKDLFKCAVNTELGPMNPVFCKFAHYVIDRIPDYFWAEPASSSGKHHPEYGLGEGGLARHSLMTYRWLKMLVEANDQNMSDFVPGMAFACLFHDCCKRGRPGEVDLEHTKFEHPILAAKFVLDLSTEFIANNKGLFESTIEDEDAFKQNVAVAVSCIESHMGRWNTDVHSTTILPKPKTAIQYMVHLADYCASRKCTVFDVSWFSENYRA